MNNRYVVQYAKTGRSKCKDTKCKETIKADTVRVGKLTKNVFDSSEEGQMYTWYHLPCIFSSLKRARKNTKKIEAEDDLEGFSDLKPDDQEQVRQLIQDQAEEEKTEKKKGTKRKQPTDDKKKGEKKEKKNQNEKGRIGR